MGLKRKTIKGIITKKVNEWIASVEDESLREKLKKSVIVTGGCIVSMLLDEPVHDFDIYLRDKETVKAVAEYYVERFKASDTTGSSLPIVVVEDGDRISIKVKSAGVAGEDKPEKTFEGAASGTSPEYVRQVIDNPEQIEDVYEETEDKVLDSPENGKYRPVFLTTNAITLSNKVQIVLRFYGEPDEIHENYDFVHCRNFYSNWDNHLELKSDALEAILAKELKYVGSKYPICSLVRLRKFMRRGWSINAGQILKMSMQISELDLTKIEVLREQLTGVDTFYFMQLIEKLQEKDPEKVNSSYLCEIIDRLF